MRKLILTFILVVGIGTIVSAQDYKTGIGLRGGVPGGLTFKHFLSQKAAFEGLVGYSDNHGFTVTGLYEVHGNAFDVSHLNWYIGAGAHIGSWDSDLESSFVLGADGILGIEYNFSEAPINIGIDWKPFFNVLPDAHFYPDSGALSIRYIF